MIRQACFLVGGKGTRLGEATRALPKPLLEIAPGTSFLDLLIARTAAQGFDDLVLLAGHLGELVRARYDGRRVGAATLRVVVEPEPLGTAGALVAARDLLAPRFLLLNGDSYFAIDLRAFADQAVAGRSTLALLAVDDASRYGTVELAGDRVTSFREKGAGPGGPAVINGGVYALDRAILDHVGTLPCSIETEVFPALAAAGELAGICYEGYFIDIGLPDTLARARLELPDRVAG